jgi:drug/metabolite transporter (DMT)-like permease
MNGKGGIMIKNPRRRRILSLGMIILGGLLIFLAPDDVWIGVVLAMLGVGVEVAGIVLAHSNSGQ